MPRERSAASVAAVRRPPSGPAASPSMRRGRRSGWTGTSARGGALVGATEEAMPSRISSRSACAQRPHVIGIGAAAARGDRTPMRIYTTSSGLDPTALVPGEDLVLSLDERHALDAPSGVVAHDHLDHDARRAVDEAAIEAMTAWRGAHDATLTVEGICLPLVLEEHIYTGGLITSIRDAAGVDRAIESFGTRSVELMDSDPHTQRAVAAAAARRGVEVRRSPAAAAAAAGLPPGGTPRARTGLRARLLSGLVGLGVPSMLRRDCLLFLSYWPLMPLLDRMLASSDARPAIFMSHRPTGARRTLRAAVRGGWVGTPGPRRRRRAAKALDRALRGATDAPSVHLMGLDLGECIHARALEVVRRQAVQHVAQAAVFRRAIARRRVATVVLPYDIEPNARMVALLAREADVHTFLLQHGAVLLPRPLSD